MGALQVTKAAHLLFPVEQTSDVYQSIPISTRQIHLAPGQRQTALLMQQQSDFLRKNRPLVSSDLTA